MASSNVLEVGGDAASAKTGCGDPFANDVEM